MKKIVNSAIELRAEQGGLSIDEDINSNLIVPISFPSLPHDYILRYDWMFIIIFVGSTMDQKSLGLVVFCLLIAVATSQSSTHRNIQPLLSLPPRTIPLPSLPGSPVPTFEQDRTTSSAT